MLNDRIIDAAQIIMKNQFKHSPQINGFQSTIFKQNTKHFKKTNKDMFQISHRGSANSGHWFSVSTLNCDEDSINIYDSAFNDLDHDSKAQISSILKFDGKCIKLHQVSVQHQAGGSDRGLFAIAFAVPCVSVSILPNSVSNSTKWGPTFCIAWLKISFSI